MYTTQRDVQGEEIQSFFKTACNFNTHSLHIVYTYLQLLVKRFV